MIRVPYFTAAGIRYIDHPDCTEEADVIRKARELKAVAYTFLAAEPVEEEGE